MIMEQWRHSRPVCCAASPECRHHDSVGDAGSLGTSPPLPRPPSWRSCRGRARRSPNWFGIGSVRIERDTTREVTGPPFSVLDLDLGTPSTLAHAQARLGRTVATISGHVPAGVWIQPFGPAGSDSVIVNSVYATGPLKDVFGAAGGTDDAVLVSQLAGSGDVYINKKLLGQGTQMEFLTIRGERAVWLRGDPHEVLMRDAHGTIDVVPVRLAGSVLLWADSTRTIRIEGLSERSAAIAVLERIVPR